MEHRPVLPLCVLAALVCCQEDAPVEPPTTAPPPPPAFNVLRLTDLLDQATISSPVTTVESVGSLLELDVETAPVLRDPETAKTADMGWPARGACVLADHPDDPERKVIRYRGHNPHRCLLVVPAKPSTHYRVQRAVRTGDTKVDLAVMETRVRPARPKRRNYRPDIDRVLTGRFVGMRDLIYVHHFPAPTRDTWDRNAIHIFTSPYTRSLVLQLQDPKELLAGQGDEVFFDDVQVDELRPTRPQELALLKSFAAVDDDGLLKHGQLLPVDDVTRLKPPFDHNYEYRYALFAPAPTSVTFEVEVPERARLIFSHALFKASRPGDRVEFRICARAEGEESELFASTLELDPAGESWRWHDEKLALDQYAGRRVDLTFETRAPEGKRGYGLWGTPIIDVPRAEDDPPNVILIGVDTLRADRLFSFGYGRKTSPKLDALAADGFLFATAIAPTNWTSPSFASLFTGLMPSRHQVIHRARAIADDLTTVTEIFQDNGWATHGIAYKAYLYNMGFEQGFDTWFNVPDPNVRADDNLNKALAWLEANGDRRFFLFLHFNDSHQPFNLPPEFAKRYASPHLMKKLGATLPIVIEPQGGVLGCRRCTKNGKLDKRVKPLARDLYDGEVAYLDDRIGRLLTELKHRGLYEDTVVAFVADHGELMWEHDNYFGHGGATMYEQLIHVPLIIKPATKSGLAVGKTISTQVRIHDLMPTLLELAGIETELDVDVDAESLLPLMKDTTPDETRDRLAISENVKNHVVSVRDQEWKYVLSHPPGRPASEQLFDLLNDRAEDRNAAKRAPEHVRRLRRRALEFFLRDRTGLFLVVTADSKSRDYQIRVTSDRGVRTARTLFGVPLASEDNPVVFSGRGGGRLVLFAHLEVPEGATLDVHATGTGGAREVRMSIAPKDLARYQTGCMDRLQMVNEVTVTVFAGATMVEADEREQGDAAQLEALRAMGYID